jgi:hypothetical protein
MFSCTRANPKFHLFKNFIPLKHFGDEDNFSSIPDNVRDRTKERTHALQPSSAISFPKLSAAAASRLIFGRGNVYATGDIWRGGRKPEVYVFH